MQKARIILYVSIPVQQMNKFDFCMNRIEKQICASASPLYTTTRIDYFHFEIIVRSHVLTRSFVQEDRFMFRFTIYSLIAVLFIALVSAPISAQFFSWTSVGPGGGGAFYAPSISHHAGRNDLFVASDMADVFHSSNFGESWRTIHFRQLQGGHRSQVQFTSNTSLLYSLDYTVVNRIDAVVPEKSTDGGVTWENLQMDPTNGEAMTLLADPNATNRIVLSEYYEMFFSNDGGVTFDSRFSTNNGDGLHIAGAFFDGNNIYVGTNEGLLFSTNGGTSFQLSAVGGIPQDEYIVSFAGAKQNNVTRFFCVTNANVYAGITGADFGGYRGVYSLDFGQQNWTARSSGITAGNSPFFVSMAANNISVAYVAGGSGSAPIVFKTSNGGTSWQSVFLTNNNQNILTGWSGYQGDRDWSYGEYALGFTVCATDPSKVMITDLGFVHVTSDGGASWKQAYVQPADQNAMNAPTPKGKAYHGIGLENTSAWHLLWCDNLNMIACYTDIRGAISSDGGITWSFNYTGHTLNTMYHALKHPTTGIVYAATSSIHDLYESTYLTDARIDNGTGQVLFSTNKGKTWQLMHNFGHPVIWLALDPNNPNRMYASVVHSSAGGIYVSNDIQNGGSSVWTKLTNPPRTEGHPLNIFVLNDGMLLCSYSGRRANNAFTQSSGVFVSTNGGTSWIDRSNSSMLYWTKDVYVDPTISSQNTWYACVYGGWGGAPNNLGGLYRTTDRGISWSQISWEYRVGSVAVSPTLPARLYFTTETEGLWFTPNKNVAVPAFQQVSYYPFRHPKRIYFDPYSSFRVWVTSFGNGISYSFEWDPPVELESFNATLKDDGVHLNWITATETNNHGFEIERRAITNNQKGSWVRIGFVAGSGTTTNPQAYSFIDEIGLQSDVRNLKSLHFRLKQIDTDGSFEYSPTVEVALVPSGKDAILFDVYPNPVTATSSPIISFWLNDDRHARLEVSDAMGRNIATLYDGEATSGLHEVRFAPMENSAGLYFCKLVVDGTLIDVKKIFTVR